MTPERLEAIRIRADLVCTIADGPNALRRALASADDVPELLAAVEQLTAERDRLRAQLAAATPVLDAAQAWRAQFRPASYTSPPAERLIAAVDAAVGRPTIPTTLEVTP